MFDELKRLWLEWGSFHWFWIYTRSAGSCSGCACARITLQPGSGWLWLHCPTTLSSGWLCSITPCSSCTACWSQSTLRYLGTFCWICVFAWSAITFMSLILTLSCFYLSTSLLFCRSRSYRSAPSSWFLKALASTAAWFSFMNCLRWLISLSYLLSFSCSYLFCCCFCCYLYLNYWADLSFTCYILCRSSSSYFFLRRRSYSFIRDCSALLFIIISFFSLMLRANWSFFFRFSCRFCSYSRRLVSWASTSRSRNSCRDISSRSPYPIVSVGLSTFGLTFCSFSSSRISRISSFFLTISTASYSFFFSNILFIYYLPSSCAFLFFYTTFSRSTSIFSFFSFTSSTNLFFI